jgi:methionine-rich copper-binding protein CopC
VTVPSRSRVPRLRSLLGALLLLLPAVAHAHAVLVKSAPARRAVLSTPPGKVELSFNERLEPAYSTVSVWSAANARVDDGKVVVGPDDPRRLTVGVPSLGAGQYTVKFRVLSVDGHVVEGHFPFEIRPRP